MVSEILPGILRKRESFYPSGTTAIASTSNTAASRASFEICTAVEDGGALGHV